MAQAARRGILAPQIFVALIALKIGSIVAFLSPRAGGAVPRWQDLVHIYLSRNAANASTFFHIPAARTVELGSQLSI